MSDNNTDQKRTRLTRKDSFRVLHWVNANLDKLKSCNRFQAARLCSHDLGIDITPDNIRNIVTDANLPIPWMRWNPQGRRDRTVMIAKGLLILHDVVSRALGGGSIGGLLPTPQREAFLKTLDEVDIAGLQALTKKDSPES